MKKLMIIAALVFFASCANAQVQATKPPPNAVQSMINHILVARFNFSLYLGGEKARTAADEGAAHLTTDIKPALAAADGHPDLIAAIKALYIAAHTYFDSAHAVLPMPTYIPGASASYEAPEALALKNDQSRMKADVDAKINAVKLEMELAGLTDG